MTKLSFGQYRLVAELGQGGMADVSLALQQGPVGFNKLVVIKKAREHLADEPEFIEMLLDEARLAARLNHPNIVQTLEVGEADGVFFIAMEYLEGQPFTRVRRRHKKAHDESLPFDVQAYVLAECLDGLHHAHELKDFDGTPLGVIHRDVTPSNVFVTYEGQVKLVDFGIAKASSRSTVTKTGVVKGKVTYMPPEQAIGAEVDRRADIFAVGVMLWEAALGRRMWQGMDDIHILGKLVNSDIPMSVRAVDPSLSEELDALIAKSLAPDPSDRYATADEFRLAIEAYLLGKRARMNMRELGRAMNELFADDRKRVQALVESQLAKIENTSLNAEPIEIPPASSLVHSAAGASASASVPPAPTAAPVAPAPNKAIPVVVGLIAAAGAAAFLGMQSKSPPPAPAPVVTVAPAAPPVEPEAKKIKLMLRATPANAMFVMDDGRMLRNPYIDVVESDGKDHAIEIKAEGYAPKTVTVSFQSDVDLEVDLQKIDGEEDDVKDDTPATRRVYVPRRTKKKTPTPTPRPQPDLLGGDPWKD